MIQGKAILREVEEASPSSSESDLNYLHAPNVMGSTGAAIANDFSCNTRAIDKMIDENISASKSRYQDSASSRLSDVKVSLKS